MKTINAIIERTKDGTYNVYCTEEFFSGVGDTVGAAKEDLFQQMKLYKETAISEGFKYPAFLDEEFSIRFA